MPTRNKPSTPAEIRRGLATPNRSLPLFGWVHDQETGTFRRYDPFALTWHMQAAILDYWSEQPTLPDGSVRWLTVLAGRQGGKSLTAEFCAYVKAAFTPGWDHATIADTRDRSDYLHQRVHYLHERWDEEFRAPRASDGREVRQMTFEPASGGKMRVLSAESGAVGVGQSPDSFHGSEPHLWADFAGTMNLVLPSMVNRKHCLATFEATPWEADTDWHNHCLDAKAGRGRHLYQFFPFWDNKLCQRKWEPGWTPDNEELRRIERWGEHSSDGHYGGDGRFLTWDHLAFRRFMLDQDREIRRRPELFEVLYPSDDVSCWLSSATSAIPRHALERHRTSTSLVHWQGDGYQEYEPPGPTSRTSGADPRPWRQVACYAAHTDPVAFARELVRVGHRYGNAVIAVESNGVGQATIALLREWEYENLLFEGKGKPGLTTTAQSLDRMIAWTIDALMDELDLADENTVEQLLSYRHDKVVEENVKSELVRGEPTKRRRERHHWDKVSALMIAVAAIRRVPTGSGANPHRFVIGADPCGHAARDHAAFQVLRVEPHVHVLALGAKPDDAASDVPHSGLYTRKGQEEKWREARSGARDPFAPPPDPWYRSGGKVR